MTKESLALSAGPEQTEYTSYESPGSTDMVNLLTGDFTYSIPLVDVPGPEGGFSVPIFYNAGITPEEDASWTGLGFNINLGCITRNVVGYHDDAYDNSLSVNVNDPGGSAWVKNYVFYKRTYDSEKGYGGGINLLNIIGAEWNSSSGLQAGTFVGLNFNKNGVKGYWAENVMNVGNVAMTILSLGSSFVQGAAAAKTSVLDVVQDAVVKGSRLFEGYLSQGTFSSKYFNWDQTTDVSNLGFKVNYKYWLDDTRTERAFGALYLGSTENTSLAPVLTAPDYNTLPSYKVATVYPRIDKVPFEFKPSKGFITSSSFDLVTSDMYLNVLPNEDYSSVVRPNHISFDQYNVMTSGIGGNISPYRVEIGSVAQPKRYSQYTTSHNLIPFIEEDYNENKVQFYYNGQFSNKYLYHDDPSFGISHSLYTGAAGSTYDKAGEKYMQYSITNDKFLGGDRSESDASRLKNKKIVSGKNIEWYTNEEITTGAARTNGFMDINVSRSQAPKGIGGFSITKEDGITYHYALPVYRTLEIDMVGTIDEEEQKYSRAVNQNPVAITWLLTSITGPDFIDRGVAGKVDDQDWGYWVKFDYGITSSDYSYRFPYYGYYDDGTSLSYSQGRRDQYYLNSIETRSHKALFIKAVRTDGLSSYLKKNDPNFGHDTESGLETPTPPLSLDEIILLSKSDFTKLSDLGFNTMVNSSLGFPGLLGNNGTLSNVYDIGDIQGNTSFGSFINANALKRIKLVYETDENLKLCKKSLNSFTNLGNPPPVDATDIYLEKNGKLTLRKIQFYGRNNLKILPDYKFEYGYNPDYNKNHWDGWGYYNPSGTSAISSHKASQLDQHGTAWSLTKIITPLGGTISIDYQRDSYSTVSGERLSNIASSYSNPNSSIYFPGDINKLVIPNVNNYTLGEQVRVSGEIYYKCAGSSFEFKSYSTDCTITEIGSNYLRFAEDYMDIGTCDGANPATFIEVQSQMGSLRQNWVEISVFLS